jgi:hypothetical protein
VPTSSISRGYFPTRRRRVRHKFRRPLYASLNGKSQTATFDLSEVLDISEDGLALQGRVPPDEGCEIQLSLELAEIGEKLSAKVQVVWSDAACRSGLRFVEIPSSSLRRLREWLLIKAISSWSERQAIVDECSRVAQAPINLGFADAPEVVKHLQVQVESLEADLDARLDLIAKNTLALMLRASAAAIALCTRQPEVMICRARAGSSAPPLGAELHVGSGFSGLCIRSRTPLICRDTETDCRVDADQCRALGVRSILAAPVRVGESVVALIEVFSPHPDGFSSHDLVILNSLGKVLVDLLDRSQPRQTYVVPPHYRPAEPLKPGIGGVPVFSADRDGAPQNATGRSSAPRVHVIVICVVAIVSLALGVPGLWRRRQLQNRVSLQAPAIESRFVLAPSAPAPPGTNEAPLHLEDANLATLKQLAGQGSAEAENVLGQRYLDGDKREALVADEKEAARWFSASAEKGNVVAQAKLGFLFWSGRGVPQNLEKAYFWATVASMNAGPSSREPMVVLARDLRKALAYSDLSRAHAVAIERQAQRWRPRK